MDFQLELGFSFTESGISIWAAFISAKEGQSKALNEVMPLIGMGKQSLSA